MTLKIIVPREFDKPEIFIPHHGNDTEASDSTTTITYTTVSNIIR